MNTTNNPFNSTKAEIDQATFLYDKIIALCKEAPCHNQLTEFVALQAVLHTIALNLDKHHEQTPHPTSEATIKCASDVWNTYISEIKEFKLFHTLSIITQDPYTYERLRKLIAKTLQTTLKALNERENPHNA